MFGKPWKKWHFVPMSLLVGLKPRQCMAHRVIDWLRLKGTLKITKMFFLAFISIFSWTQKKLYWGLVLLFPSLSAEMFDVTAWAMVPVSPWHYSGFLSTFTYLLAGIKIQYFIWISHILIMRNIWKLSVKVLFSFSLLVFSPLIFLYPILYLDL